MKKNLKIMLFSTILMMLVGGMTSCEREPDKLDDLCSHINMKDINKTIPTINNFLNGLPSTLSDEEKKKELGVWMMESCSLPYYVDISASGTFYLNLGVDEFLFNFILDFSESGQLRATQWRGNLPKSGEFYIGTRPSFTIDSVFDFINSLDIDVKYIQSASSEFTLLVDETLQQMLDYLNAKPYVRDVGDVESSGYIFALLSDMKNKNHQTDWLETSRKYKITINVEYNSHSYSIYFQVPAGMEWEWVRKFRKYEYEFVTWADFIYEWRT
jgi:hypothetical protein